MKKKGSGGAREGAGRPKSGRETIWFRFALDTIEQLRKLVPPYERSQFVEGLVRKALANKEKKS